MTIAEFGSRGLAGGLTHWSLWALVVLGPLGFLLNQNAFRESELVSPTLAVITVADPLVGIGIGVLWLNETIWGTPGAVLGEVLGLAAMALGVWLVAHRAPHLSEEVAACGARAEGEPPQAPSEAGSGPPPAPEPGQAERRPAPAREWRGRRRSPGRRGGSACPPGGCTGGSTRARRRWPTR